MSGGRGDRCRRARAKLTRAPARAACPCLGHVGHRGSWPLLSRPPWPSAWTDPASPEQTWPRSSTCLRRHGRAARGMRCFGRGGAAAARQRVAEVMRAARGLRRHGTQRGRRRRGRENQLGREGADEELEKNRRQVISSGGYKRRGVQTHRWRRRRSDGRGPTARPRRAADHRGRGAVRARRTALIEVTLSGRGKQAATSPPQVHGPAPLTPSHRPTPPAHEGHSVGGGASLAEGWAGVAPVERVRVHHARHTVAQHVARDLGSVKVGVIGRLLAGVIDNLGRRTRGAASEGEWAVRSEQAV
eukprot:scaffold21265_cov131-Isochrysis_galbana.AAC.11